MLNRSLVSGFTICIRYMDRKNGRVIRTMSCLLVFSCRRYSLEKKLADAEVSEEEQNNILKYLEIKETEYMRLQRHKMGSDDFEPLTMIGKGAFGEVSLVFSLPLLACGCTFVFLFSLTLLYSLQPFPIWKESSKKQHIIRKTCARM